MTYNNLIVIRTRNTGIKSRWNSPEIRNHTLRKRKAKGKLFRKSCNGCVTKEEYERDKTTVICRMPYKGMQYCPCKDCLVKITCDAFCEKFENARIKYDKRYAAWLKRVKSK